MEDFPVSVANETLFFELFRFQKGGPMFFFGIIPNISQKKIRVRVNVSVQTLYIPVSQQTDL